GRALRGGGEAREFGMVFFPGGGGKVRCFFFPVGGVGPAIFPPPPPPRPNPPQAAAPARVDGIRVAAEWEPVVGVLIGWPLEVPCTLVVEMAKEVDLYVTVSDPQNELCAKRTLAGWGICQRRGHLIIPPPGSGGLPPAERGP